MTISVDLGSGGSPRNIFNADTVLGVDTFDQDSPKVIKHDLDSGTLPFEDSSVDYVLAFDCLEHINRIGFRLKGESFEALELEKYNPFLDMMSSIWRILKPGGILYAMTPVVPHFNEVFRDPTHVNAFTPDMVNYFCSDVPGSMHGLTRHYGFTGNFTSVKPQKLEGAHVHWHLGAVK